MPVKVRKTYALPLPEYDIREMERFCHPDSDRYEVLTDSLRRRKIKYETIPLDGARHVVLPLQGSGELDRDFYRVTLVAHYDRVEGTPGANDNAASVFQLLAHWEEISALGWPHRIQVLFTDREELTGSMKPEEQGACSLARHLQRLGVKNVLFFVLDMCGIGTTPIWGQSPEKMNQNFPDLPSAKWAYSSMTGFLKTFSRGEDFGINTMFSDDLGLLLGGYPALQVSLLTRNEAESLRMTPESLKTSLPPSWQAMHSKEDTLDSLEAGAFKTIRQILKQLTRHRFSLR